MVYVSPQDALFCLLNHCETQFGEERVLRNWTVRVSKATAVIVIYSGASCFHKTVPPKVLQTL